MKWNPKQLTRNEVEGRLARGRLSRSELVGALLLVAMLGALYWPVSDYDFLNYDDDIYVTRNQAAASGLTRASVQWSFTTFYAGNWHPLTWLSHLADIQLFGLNPAAHHLSSVILHVASCLVLFLTLARLTGSTTQSLFVAAVFGVHPLQVESVAWVAERKNILSALFGFLTLAAYRLYAARPQLPHYLLVCAAFVCSLLAKPALVTLPVLLVLLDYWPLDRLGKPQKPGAISSLRILVEKVPLFALAAAVSLATYVAQREGGNLAGSTDFSLQIRLGNAVISYVTYAWKALWPTRLAVFYPHPGALLPIWKVVAAALALCAITAAAVRMARRKPAAIVGWLWYLAALLPTVGFVQVGLQARADRYAYVPMVGLAVALAWAIADYAKGTTGRRALRIAAITGVGLLAWTAGQQLRVWRNSETLFLEAIRVTDGNWLAHGNLGAALILEGRTTEAEAHLREAIRYRPGYAEAHNNLGVAIGRRGDMAAAENEHREAIRLAPGYAPAHYNLGVVLERLGRRDEAGAHHREAIRLNPDFADAHNNLGWILATQGRNKEAIREFSEALRADPRHELARKNLVWMSGRTPDFHGGPQ
jgi:tetratricopeptide (TPR) repeat protein